jgi:guanine deaminase
MPGFVDTHNHAPQAAQRGLGQDTKLLAWLEDVVFTTEARFADADHARAAYDAVVRAMLRQGITTAAYYGSLHSEATRILVDACLEHGQRALVGKCNMDRGAPEWYRDADVEASLQATRECIAHVRERDPQGDLVKYVVTPRFAISCSGPLLEGLGKIAAGEDAAAAADDDGNNNNNKKAPLPIQTHFAEAAGEIRATLSLFPEFSSEAELYASFGLLTPRTVLAHCTRMSEAETARVRDAGCGIAHCPTANMTVGGGFMAAPVAKWLRQWGMEKVGLGTDIGGGFAPGMLDAMRHARIASCARAALDRVAAKATLAGSSGSSSSSNSSGGGGGGGGGGGVNIPPRDRDCADAGLTLEELVYLATLGGARALGLGDETGSFEAGRRFDGLVVDMGAARGGVNAPVGPDEGARRALEKFVMTGDDRNVAAVFVGGRRVAGDVPEPGLAGVV